MSAPLECTAPAAVLAAVREDARRPALARLMLAAKRVDDFLNCRLGTVVPDEVRSAIFAELTAAVAAAAPYIEAILSGLPAVQERKAA